MGYPREVGILPGMPEGWKGIERQFGPDSKSAGQIYCRWTSNDGRHKGLLSPVAVIKAHCEDNGLDAEPMLDDYKKILNERRDKKRKGGIKLPKDVRDECIMRFEANYGKLAGPIVFQFPGWTTRWDYLPDCNQTAVTYTDTEGREWKILKELEAYFQHKMDTGDGDGIDVLIETAKAKQDVKAFENGAKQARETKGRFEILATGETRAIDQDARKRIVSKESTADMVKRHRAFEKLDPIGPPQSGWATLQNDADIRLAFDEFRTFISKRGFPTSTVLVALTCSDERRYAARIRGVYYEMPDECKIDGHSSFQRLVHFPAATNGAGADCIYVIWSLVEKRWEVTMRPFAGAGAPCLAYCEQSKESLQESCVDWHVQDGDGVFHKDIACKVITS